MDGSLFSVIEELGVGISWRGMKKSDAGIQVSSVSSIDAFEVALLISIKPLEGPRVGRFYGEGLKVYTLQALFSFHWLGLSHTVTLSCRGSWEMWSVTPGRERSRSTRIQRHRGHQGHGRGNNKASHAADRSSRIRAGEHLLSSYR